MTVGDQLRTISVNTVWENVPFVEKVVHYFVRLDVFLRYKLISV